MFNMCEVELPKQLCWLVLESLKTIFMSGLREAGNRLIAPE